MKIAVAGKNGMLGFALVKTLSQNYNTVGLSRQEMDITNIDNTTDVICSISPDVVINSAAYTDVDGCETVPDKAYSVNSYGARNLAVACLKTASKLVYISTDYVFSGQNGHRGYQVDDQTAPLNIYGKSKLLGELFTRTINPCSYIIRTSWLYGPNGKNFVDTVRNMDDTELRIVDDQTGSPTYTFDLAATIGEIIKKEIFGTYHVTNAGYCSWFEFAKEILRLSGKQQQVVLPIKSTGLKRTAKRPAFSTLNNNHLRLNGIDPPRDWKSALKGYILPPDINRLKLPDV